MRISSLMKTVTNLYDWARSFFTLPLRAACRFRGKVKVRNCDAWPLRTAERSKHNADLSHMMVGECQSM